MGSNPIFPKILYERKMVLRSKLFNFFFGLNVKKINCLRAFYGIQFTCKQNMIHHVQFGHMNLWTKKSVFVGDAYWQQQLLFFKKIIMQDSFRKFRFLCGLPVRGQRSRSNSKTAKKKYSVYSKILSYLFFIR